MRVPNDFELDEFIGNNLNGEDADTSAAAEEVTPASKSIHPNQTMKQEAQLNQDLQQNEQNDQDNVELKYQMAQIEELSKQKEQGLITEEEFDKKKKQILGLYEFKNGSFLFF